MLPKTKGSVTMPPFSPGMGAEKRKTLPCVAAVRPRPLNGALDYCATLRNNGKN